MAENTTPDSPELTSLLNNKEDGYEYRERRQQDWLENYTLYRDKVRTNRLTQRQSVNIPIMKQSIRTLLKDVDDMPVLYLENLDNDKQKETFQNEYWKWTEQQNRMELQDIVDKKQVFLFGRSFDQWQIMDGAIKMTIQDPQDILVSRYTDPTDLHSSRFLIHTHIYVPFKEIEANENYDKKAVKALKEFIGTNDGLIKVASNEEMAREKDQKMQDMGMDDVDSPILGEAYIELTLHFVYDSKEGEEEQLYLKIEADNNQIIMSKPLEEVIGVTTDNFFRTHFPYVTWADDIERQDFWSDGIADMIRTPNKILNSWFSQLVENRTLRNFGMHYYDASQSTDFSPQTFNPQPWGWYPVPGKPSDFMQKVDIPDLGSDSMDEIDYLTNVVQKASGATATQQGQVQERSVTLGEVQLALGEAKERIKGMSKFYTQAWKDRGIMFLKMVEAAADKLEPVKIYKKGKNSQDVFEREIGPEDWKTKSGYSAMVWSQDEKDAHDSETLQKLQATVTLIPGNVKLIDIYQRKLLEFAGLKPDEINDVMESERERMELMQGQSLLPGAQPGAPTAQPATPIAPPVA
jgi:hypothetical protein